MGGRAKGERTAARLLPEGRSFLLSWLVRLGNRDYNCDHARQTPEATKQHAKSIERWDDEGGAPSGGRVTGKHPKRPRGPKLMVDLATGNAEETDPSAGKDKAAVEMGRKGGAARASKMTPERRAEIARKAAASRWKKD